MVDARGVTGGSGRRFGTPTGEPCPRTVRVDGTVEGSGDCLGCGTCLQLGGLLEVVSV